MAFYEIKKISIKMLQIWKDIDISNKIQYGYLYKLFGDFAIKNEIAKNKIILHLSELYNKKIDNEKIKRYIYEEIENISFKKIICISACHLKNYDDFIKMSNMIDSWYLQKNKSYLIISLSSDILLDDNIDKIKNKYNGLIIEICNIKKSQFEHYEIICNKFLSEYDKYWVIFSDHDDLMLNNRILAFSFLITTCYNMNDNIDNISFVKYPYLCQSDKYYNNTGEIKYTAEQIFTNDEYICFSIKFSELNNFIKGCDSIVLQSRFCDRYLVKYLTFKKGNKFLRLIAPFLVIHIIIITQNILMVNILQMMYQNLMKKK
jgi:hypothetical protein